MHPSYHVYQSFILCFDVALSTNINFESYIKFSIATENAWTECEEKSTEPINKLRIYHFYKNRKSCLPIVSNAIIVHIVTYKNQSQSARRDKVVSMNWKMKRALLTARLQITFWERHQKQPVGEGYHIKWIYFCLYLVIRVCGAEGA